MDKFNELYNKIIAESSYRYFGGRRVTSNGFTQAIDFDGNPMFFTTANGKQEPIMMGVSEYGVKNAEELIRGETHQQSHKIGAKFILWFPNAKGYNKGITVDGKMYKDTQANLEQYPEIVQRLNDNNIPLNINCN